MPNFNTSSASTRDFTVFVGPYKIPHVVKHTTLAKIPYFESLFSFSQAAGDPTDSVYLDTEADSDEAFRMILQVLDIGTYYPPAYYYDFIGYAMVYAKLYAMADRLLMLDVKASSARFLVVSLARFSPEGRERLSLTRSRDNTAISYVSRGSEGDDNVSKFTWINERIPAVDGDCVAKILCILYQTTASPERLKKVALEFTIQDAVFRELPCSQSYCELINDCEELSSDLYQAMRSAKPIVPEEWVDYALEHSFP